MCFCGLLLINPQVKFTALIAIKKKKNEKKETFLNFLALDKFLMYIKLYIFSLMRHLSDDMQINWTTVESAEEYRQSLLDSFVSVN